MVDTFAVVLATDSYNLAQKLHSHSSDRNGEENKTEKGEERKNISWEKNTMLMCTNVTE